MMPVRFVFKMMIRERERQQNETFSSPHDAHIEQIEHAFGEWIDHNGKEWKMVLSARLVLSLFWMPV